MLEIQYVLESFTCNLNCIDTWFHSYIIEFLIVQENSLYIFTMYQWSTQVAVIFFFYMVWEWVLFGIEYWVCIYYLVCSKCIVFTCLSFLPWCGSSLYVCPSKNIVLREEAYWKFRIGDLTKQITIYIQMVPFLITPWSFKIKTHTSWRFMWLSWKQLTSVLDPFS